MIKHYDYILKHYEEYKTGLTRDQFIELLNILESNDEDLETFHSTIFNGHDEFCGIWHNGGTWETEKELYKTLLDFHYFIKRDDLRNYLITRTDDIVFEAQSIDEVKEYFLDEINELTATTDGYVKRYNY